MAQDTKKKSSTVALLAAFAVLLITILGFGWNVFLSAVLAAAAFFVVVQFGRTTVSEVTEPVRSATAHQVTPVAETPDPAEAAVPPAATETASVASEAASRAGQVKLGTLLPGERELAERRGGWRYEA
ncbi:hypothetical protein [uncultured Shimia sp.]|uniref:hypothetical protein n=1 Tax=uncultured Shimia sp. TaxID=573152 RepID=UPI0026115BB1|nr:hypothetical protein [uncultured Shimia sp.]